MVTTAEIVVRKVLLEGCGQECVDWAIHLLEEGQEGEFVCRLAGMLPPYNHFEIAALRDQVLDELGQPEISAEEAIRLYSLEVLESYLEGDIQTRDALTVIKDLYLSDVSESELTDLWLLYNAYCDLELEEFQFYWPAEH